MVLICKEFAMNRTHRVTHLELADALELHGLSGEVFSRGDGVGEDVQQEGAATGRVHAERHHVADHRLT